MANQPTKYRKFVVGAASAALVASAVAPVASAKDFSDTKGNTHEAAIDALSDAGIINGYEDGTFKPNKTLTRSDVVKMMGKWLVAEGYEVPSDYKTNPRFTDLTSATNDELLKYAAVVKDNGVFNGSNGRLLAGDNMSRENMAVVLVRAFDTVKDINLVEYVQNTDYKKEVADLNSAKSEARPAIEVLDFFDITTVAQFNPKDTTTRGHFATFLNNFLNADLSKVTGVVAGVDSITAVNTTTVEVKFVDAVEDLAALNFKIDGLEITNKVIKQTDAKTVVLTTAAQEGGKVYTVTANDNKLGTFNGVSAVIPTGISVVTPSQQGVIGKDVTVSATVTVPEGQSKAGVPVTFNITNSSNNNGKLEAVAYTNDQGVASYTYTRYYSSEDSVAAYATSKSDVVSTGKVYWDNAIQLAVEEITAGNDLANETKKSYKVTGDVNTVYYIAIKENLGVTPDKVVPVNVQNYNTTAETSDDIVTPYSLTTGSTVVAAVRTNANGEGSFTLYGSNLEATPIVYDPTTVSATSKNYNRLALQAQAPTVKFSQVDKLAVAVTAEGTANSAASDLGVATVGKTAGTTSIGGRTYTVTVTDKDGKVAPSGTKAYVTFEAGNYAVESGKGIYFQTGSGTFENILGGVNGTTPKVFEVTVGAEGKAKFRVAGNGATSFVKPTVFLNTAGAVNAPALDKTDVQTVAEVTYFKAPTVSNAVLTITDSNGRAVTSLASNQYAYFTYQTVDQNGFAYKPTAITTGTTTQTIWVPVRNAAGEITHFIQDTITDSTSTTQYTLSFDVTSLYGTATVVTNPDGTPLTHEQNYGNTKTYQVKSDANGKAIVRVTSENADTVTVNVTGINNFLPTKSASVSFTGQATPIVLNGTVEVASYAAETVKIGGQTVSISKSVIKYGNSTLDAGQFLELLTNNVVTAQAVRDSSGVYNFTITSVDPATVTPKTVEKTITVGDDAITLTASDLATSNKNLTLSIVDATSSAATVATASVDNNKLVINAVGAGTANVTVNVTDGTVTKPVTVKVNVNANAPVEGEVLSDLTDYINTGGLNEHLVVIEAATLPESLAGAEKLKLTIKGETYEAELEDGEFLFNIPTDDATLDEVKAGIVTKAN